MYELSYKKDLYIKSLYFSIKARCENPKDKGYKNYGARGITMYQEWNSWQEFGIWLLDNLGHRPTPKYSIDRIDNNGNYEPGNLRWATSKQQALNRRDNKPRTAPIKYKPHYRCFVICDGIKMSQAHCARYLKLDKSTISHIKSGNMKNHYGLVFI